MAVVSVLVLPPGDAVVVLVLVLVLLLLSEPPPPLDGEGLIIVVLLVPPAGEAAGDAPGAVFSIRCSQPARSAALAMMQRYFVIIS